MQINHMAATFGKLDNAQLTLQPGLNIIYAPNESGKSTWCHFIRTMFYGFPSRERGPLSERHRYAPWSGAAMSGAMTCTHSGQTMTAIRYTRRADAPMGEFRCTYLGTDHPVADITAVNFGQTLLGVSRDVYVRSALIGQGHLALDKDADLERRIASLVSSGEEETSFSDSYDRLKKQLNRRKHNKTGLIPALEQEIAQLEASLQQLHSLHQREQTLLTQLSQLEQQARDLQARLDQWDALEKQSALQACLQAQEAFHQAQHRVHSLQDHCPSLPLAEQLSRMSGLADALERMQDDVRRTERAVADAQNDAAIAQSLWEAHPLYPADQQQLSARLDRIVPNNTRFSLWAVLLALLTGSAAGLGLWHVLFHVAAAIAAGAGVCAAHLIIYNSIRLHRNRVAYTQAETQRNALRAEIAAYVQLLQQHNAAQERAQRAGASAQTLHHSYHEGLLQLLGFVHPFAPDAADPAAIRTALDRGLQLRVELDLAQREAADAQQRYDFLRQNLPQGPLPDPTESLPRPSISHTQLSGALLRVTDNIQSLRSQLDVLKGQIHAAGDRDTLESRLVRKRSELSRLQEEYQAITTAMDALSRADQTMQSRFSPELGRRAAEIFGALTGGKYRQVLFDRSFALSATPSDGSIPRSIQLLSQGAADQLYLATRLAICEMVLPADKSIPLILDDALANFDQQRMMAALDWLADAARHRQILLFTCHTREIEYLSDRDNVTYLSL